MLKSEFVLKYRSLSAFSDAAEPTSDSVTNAWQYD